MAKYNKNKRNVGCFQKRIKTEDKENKNKNNGEKRKENICNIYKMKILILLCALSVGSRLSVTRRFDENSGPESTSWMIILIASPSSDV